MSISITYPACTCNCKEEWVKLEKEQTVHQFIAGLNESYGGIRRNILMMKPLPDIDSVYLMLIHDEQQSELQTSIPSIKPLTIPYLISLPNAYKVKVTCIRSLPLYSYMTLHNVLLVPSFQYNLISLHKLLL